MSYRLLCLAATLCLAVFSASVFALEHSPRLNVLISQTSEDVGFDIASDVSGSFEPNILSELKWTDMSVTHLTVDYMHPFGEKWRVNARVDYGYIDDGNVLDSDFALNNRMGEFSRSESDVTGKQSLEASVSIGYAFNWAFEVPLWRIGETNQARAFASVIELVPRIGYSQYKTELQFENGVQLIPDLGAFEGLDSSYDSEWRGAFVGADLMLRLVDNLYLVSSATYYPDFSYEADGHWNLRGDLLQPKSFKQSADATGLTVRTGLEWTFANNKSVSVAYQDTQFDTDKGVDQTNTVFGVPLFTRLNEANWRSHGWVFRFEYRFH